MKHWQFFLIMTELNLMLFILTLDTPIVSAVFIVSSIVFLVLGGHAIKKGDK